MRLMRSILVLLTYAVTLAGAIAQDAIQGLGVSVSDIKVLDVTAQVTFFRHNSGKTDSIPTERLTDIWLKDSVHLVVVPEALRGRRSLVTYETLSNALRNKEYTTALRSYVHFYYLKFVTIKGELRLDNESRAQFSKITDLFKNFPELTLSLVVHADSVGKEATNQLLTERRAKVLSSELSRSGIASNRYTMSAKGESEPFATQPSLSRRIELSIAKIAKTELFYAQKYVPPPLPPKVAKEPAPLPNSTPTPPTSDNEQPKQTNNYRYWTLTVGGEAAQFIASQSPQWADEQVGMGLKTGVGGGIRYTFRLNRSIGLVGEAGYSQWASSFYFKQNSDTLYNHSIKLYRVPLSIGTKLFIVRQLYLLPKVHFEVLQLHETGVNRDESLKPNRTQRIAYWGGSGTLGYELQLGGRLVADLSVSYFYLRKKVQLFDFTSHPNDPIHAISFRLGFGLSSFLKQ